MIHPILKIIVQIVQVRLFLLAISIIFIFFSCNTNEGNHNVHKPETIQTHDSTGMRTMSKEMDTGHNNAQGHSFIDTGDHGYHDEIDSLNINDNGSSNDIVQSDTYWNALPTNRTVISSQQAINPVNVNVNFTFSGNGYITYDWIRNRQVPVRIGGRIERLYVKYNYQYVKKGEKILDLYSPEINTYIEEFLFFNHQPQDSVLKRKAKEKLLLLGLTPFQLEQLNETGRAPFSISIYSPIEGYVLFNPSGFLAGSNSAGNTSGGMNAGMNSASRATPGIPLPSLPDNNIREGMYVSKDQTLFWINDFKEVWGIVAFTKENEKYLKKGMSISIISELQPDKIIHTSIKFLEQIYQQGQKFSQARVYLPNAAGLLRQNSLITATITVPVNTMVIPASSVYYLGKISIVWVRVGITNGGNNIFQSRVVLVGHRDKDVVEVLQGLDTKESIAKDAGYLADSETIINYLDRDHEK